MRGENYQPNAGAAVGEESHDQTSGSAVSQAEPDALAPIQQCLSQELMTIVFSKLDPYSLARAAVVCRQWRCVSEHPRLWQQACAEAFRLSVPDPSAMQRLMMTQYRFSWKRMFVHHPHLRFDGLYVSRNTYVKTGVVEFTNHKPVHLVTYFRYFRFFPDGSFLYRTSPHTVAKVAKSLRLALPTVHAMLGPRFAPQPPPAPAATAATDGDGASGGDSGGGGSSGQPRGRPDAPDGGHAPAHPAHKPSPAALAAAAAAAAAAASGVNPVFAGRYIMRGEKVSCALVYPNAATTELRCRLALRCSRPGAHDVLDIAAITTYDRELGGELPAGPQLDPDEEEQPGAGGRKHSRGTSPCVFVAWEGVTSSHLNLPPNQMDFMIV